MKGVDVDGDERITVHRQILLERPLLRSVFKEYYTLIQNLDRKFFSGDGKKIELGSGTGLMKDYIPDVLLTDIVSADHLDMILDAQNMTLPNESVRSIYGINCFHHFPDPRLFFNELHRVLVPGGGCVLIEPYYGPFASIFWKHLFDHEDFDKTQTSWELDPNQMGANSGANQALSYIVFNRDRKVFEKTYPSLEIVYHRRIPNYLRRLASGGLNFKQLVPSWSQPLLKATEKVLRPVEHLFVLDQVIVLRKKI